MNYYDLTEKQITETGIDYDLCACLEYNPQGTFVAEDIRRVIAVWEGEKDENDWRWVIELKKPIKGNKFIFLQGGCDYTGWDCQSSASHALAKSALEAAEYALGNIPASDLITGTGLGKMTQVLGGEYMKDKEKVRDELIRQIKVGKNKTWREKKDKEMGIKR